MKRIVEKVNGKGRRGKASSEQVKLRLRGKGSGFEEGPNKEESSEPL